MEKTISSDAYKNAPDGSSRQRGSKLYRLATVRGRFQTQAAYYLRREHPEVRAALLASKGKADRLRQVREELLGEGDRRFLFSSNDERSEADE